MTCKIKKIKFIKNTLTIFLFAFLATTANATKLPIDLAQELQRHGYSSDTQEQIIEAATKAESYYVRFSEFQVRWRSAHFLGKLGDRSGLERMRQDLKEFAPNNGAPISPDPNVIDPNKIKEREAKRNLRLHEATVAATVLAELGDRRGYELAARMALEGPWKWQRHWAIRCLVEIAKTDQATLVHEGIDPTFVLRAVAESEKDTVVLRTLTSFATSLDDDTGIQIIETVTNSPNASEKAHREAQVFLDKVKARKKASEKQSQIPSE